MKAAGSTAVFSNVGSTQDALARLKAVAAVVKVQSSSHGSMGFVVTGSHGN
jgi:hypothetical protein